MKKEIICTVCPRGCYVSVSKTGDVVAAEGYGCKRGEAYAISEYTAPVRILTTTVKIDGKDNELLPVRSSKPLLKEKQFACVEELKKVTVKLPVRMHEVIVADVCGTGVDIIATKEII